MQLHRHKHLFVHDSRGAPTIIPGPRFGKVKLRIKPETCEEDDQR